MGSREWNLTLHVKLWKFNLIHTSYYLYKVNINLILCTHSWFPEESNQYSTDLMARALMDSTIFVVFISTSYANDRSCTDIFKYAKLTLGKPMVVIVVGEDNYSWRKTNLGLLLPDVVSKIPISLSLSLSLWWAYIYIFTLKTNPARLKYAELMYIMVRH